jgi:hypothetical protein
MPDAPRDQNFIPGKLAVLNTDTVQGTTKIAIVVSSGGFIKTVEGGTISFTMVPVDPKDQNYVNCWLFKGLDGLLYPAVADSEGKLLIDRT